MRNKELPPEGESPKRRIFRALDFIFNPGVGQKDEPNINYHRQAIEENVPLAEEQGEDPAEFISMIEEASRNYGGLSRFKQKVAGSLISIFSRGGGSQKSS